ncbi:MAG: hypothetical protein PHY87_03795 [Sphaerochaeta sp.]|nr:hypothetical protein [Sphaerochaeta sp.]
MNKKRIVIVAVVLIVSIAALSAAPWQGRAAATPAQGRMAAAPMQGRMAAAPAQGRMMQAQAVQQRQMLQDCILEDGTLAEVPAELQELVAARRAEAEARQAANQADRVGYGKANSQRPNRNW